MLEAAILRQDTYLYGALYRRWQPSGQTGAPPLVKSSRQCDSDRVTCQHAGDEVAHLFHDHSQIVDPLAADGKAVPQVSFDGPRLFGDPPCADSSSRSLY